MATRRALLPDSRSRRLPVRRLMLDHSFDSLTLMSIRYNK